MRHFLTIIAVAAIAAGCRSTADTAMAPPATTPATPMHRAMPRAVIYKTNGDYINNLPVTLSADGKTVVSYPDPADITDLSAPIPLADGYLLDRRGVSENSRFTRYTYDSYRQLKAAPSPATLIDSIIPEARITELRRLDITLQKALGDTAAVNRLIRNSVR